MNIEAFGISRFPAQRLCQAEDCADFHDSHGNFQARLIATPIAAKPRLAVSVHHDLPALENTWRGFEGNAFGTLYQTYRWCRAWQETIGRAAAVEPAVAVVRDENLAVVLLLPLQIRRTHGVRILQWLGAPHHNYGMGLVAREFLPLAAAWFGENWAAIALAAGPHDAIHLTDIPATLDDTANPFLAIANQAGANRSYRMALDADFEKLHARKHGGETRRAMRKRERALATHGEIGFGLPAGKQAVHETLETMFRQQESRMSELGVHGLFGPVERSFLHRLADIQDEADPVLAPYELTCGGETLAVMLGGFHGGTYWALISSLAAGPLRKRSPGELALRHTIQACCERGLATFDFSPGDSSYKLVWADEAVPLRCHLSAGTWKGLAWSLVTLARLGLKRTIKRSPLLRDAFNGLRRRLWGKRARLAE